MNTRRMTRCLYHGRKEYFLSIWREERLRKIYMDRATDESLHQSENFHYASELFASISLSKTIKLSLTSAFNVAVPMS